MANQTLPGYAMPVGEKLQSVFDHTGPKAYATGGELLSGSSVGLLGGFDLVITPPLALSGAWKVFPLYPVGGIACVTTVRLAWYDAVTGVEATPGTNLSAEHVRIACWGV